MLAAGRAWHVRGDVGLTFLHAQRLHSSPLGGGTVPPQFHAQLFALKSDSTSGETVHHRRDTQCQIGDAMETVRWVQIYLIRASQSSPAQQCQATLLKPSTRHDRKHRAEWTQIRVFCSIIQFVSMSSREGERECSVDGDGSRVSRVPKQSMLAN